MSRLKPQDPSLKTQYALQLLQVFFVGLTLGMMRTVIPAVAERDFGVRRGEIALIATFVIAFGLVKGVMNFVAGTMSETLGRKRVLVIGWVIALPIPWMIFHATNWWWIVTATVLLGVNQGLTWSMTLTSKLDLTRANRRGLTNGLNEFAGYSAVAIAGVVTAYLSDRLGARKGLLIFGCATIVPALLVAIIFVRETRASSLSLRPRGSNESQPSAEGARRGEGADSIRESDGAQGSPPTLTPNLSQRQRGKTFAALCQAGLFEKFIDALMWIVLPVHLVQRGIDLRDVGWVPGVYAMVWGCSQLLTGPLSDRLGRKPLIVGGMLLGAMGVALLPQSSNMPWWSACAVITGLGMGMLYPTLGAAVSDLADDATRGRMLGVYRFWRDLGYAIGAAALAMIAHFGGTTPAMFLTVAACVAASAMFTMILANETCPRTSSRQSS